MAQYTVIRSKKYSTQVEALSERDAVAQAEELPGSQWRLEEDKVVGAVPAIAPDLPPGQPS